ncbi:hypothetical protein [Nocardia sp. NPDC051832]|uniref:hypothetical protein n=1 Tax=Nocardia sp. NPDC051832 TaxID=3155673 RepID=UPI003433B097
MDENLCIPESYDRWAAPDAQKPTVQPSFDFGPTRVHAKIGAERTEWRPAMTVENTVHLQMKAADDTDLVNTGLLAIARDIKAELDGLIAMVGSDPVFGAKFTDDPNGLKARLGHALEGTTKMAGTWGELAEGQRKTGADKQKGEGDRADHIEAI